VTTKPTDLVSPYQFLDGGEVFGMNKREYFAAMAMAKMAERGNYSDNGRDRGEPEKDAKRVAVMAVLHADALIAELNK